MVIPAVEAGASARDAGHAEFRNEFTRPGRRGDRGGLETFFHKIVMIRNNLRVLRAEDKRERQAERCGQVRAATVHHPLLPIAHDVQHPVQKQGRPVPKRSLAQRWLRLLGQSAIGNRQSATAVENFASTGNREVAPMSLAEKQHCYCTNPLTHA